MPNHPFNIFQGAFFVHYSFSSTVLRREGKGAGWGEGGGGGGSCRSVSMGCPPSLQAILDLIFSKYSPQVNVFAVFADP